MIMAVVQFAVVGAVLAARGRLYRGAGRRA
jgi:hypothetical protein